MGIGKEESEDTGVDCSWIPRNPDSPVQLKPHLIHDDVQRHPNPAILSESDRTEGCLVGCLPTSNASSVGVTARQDSILHDYVQPFQFTADKTAAYWNRISFESLLNLANAASMKYMGTTTPWNHGVPFPATQWNNATYTPESQSRNANVCSSSNTPHFEPVTPEKPVGTRKRQIANTQHSCTGEQQTEEKYGEELKVARGGSTVQVLESVKEIWRETTCTSRDAASSLAEYPRMDDGGNHATELNSTPQLKPKRKKHRPKVITEGKPRPRKIAEKPDGSRETPRIKKNHAKVAETAVPCSTSETSEVQAVNQKIQEPSDSKETGTCKRKYVGRRKVPTTPLLEEHEDFVDEWTIGSGNMEENQGSLRKNPGQRARNKMSTPPTELVEVVVKQEMAGDARKTSRRALNFDMEGQLHNESLRYSLMNGVDSQPKEEFCAEEDQTTSVHVGFQIDLAARKSGSSPAPDMTKEDDSLVQTASASLKKFYSLSGN